MARGAILAIVAAALALAPAASAQVQPAGTNDFGGFRNVLPGGQGETVNARELAANQASDAVPPSFLSQLGMYTDLVQAAPGLRAPDLDRLFKPAGFGVPPADVASTVSPRPGVTIVRDRAHQVPHVYGQTRADVMFGAGYASAQDRLFMMDVLRHTGRARLTELIGPGTDDSTLRMDAAQLKVADYSEAELQGMIDDGVRRTGAEGELIRRDLDQYVAGINAYIAEARRDPDKLPGEYPALGKMPADWKATDTVAVASLIGGIFGRGGGTEALNGEILRAAQARFGFRRARRVLRDFRRADDPEAPVTTRKRFPFDDPGRLRRRSMAIPDEGSVRNRDPVVSTRVESVPTPPALPLRGRSDGPPAWLTDLRRHGLRLESSGHSNALLVAGRRSASGRPLAVMGPQVGYYSPQILMELDLHGGGIDARGAAFPGISLYVLLGRGPDFAWSATTATTDVVDEFAERLCEPDGKPASMASTHYLYKGRCIPFLTRDHVLRTTPTPLEPNRPSRTYTLKVERSVHGPVQARGTVGGDPVAIVEARSTYFHELDSAVAFKRFNGGEVTDARTFHQAAATINFAFNWFYADERDIAFLQSGWYPRRARGTDPDLPAWGTGEWDWRGFDPERFESQRLGFDRLPKDVNPRQGYIVNWNNKQAPGWRAADDQYGFGSVHRSERLEDRIRAGLRGGGKLDLVELTRIMATGATIDLRGQEVYPVVRRLIGRTRDAEAAPLLAALDAWVRDGAHRRDLNKDGNYEHGAAVALMDAWWPILLRRTFEPVLGGRLFERIRAVHPFDDPPGPGGSAYITGWYGQLEKDLRAVQGRRVRGKLSRRYCGRGRRGRCRAVLLASLKEAAAQARERRGADLAAWRVPATCRAGATPPECDQIEFTTAGAVGTAPIPWQDRPTFQQVVEVQGHRPR